MNTPAHTVLVVDDEPEIVESLRRALRNEAYRVVGTTSPLDALSTIDRGGVDLLIADIDMPELDGLALVARVRSSHPEIVRILLTGDASLESAIEAINGGEVHRYLTKPWRNEHLRTTIREALGRLDELRRIAVADREARAHETLLAELEREHPGIREVHLDDGVHTLDTVRIRGLVVSSRSPVLERLFTPHAAATVQNTDTTKRAGET